MTNLQAFAERLVQQVLEAYDDHAPQHHDGEYAARLVAERMTREFCAEFADTNAPNAEFIIPWLAEVVK